ncbi:MAG: hypothetical protein IKE73_04430 [Bacilli bacterium]|nr:hypothetical protein [Bacilli bacterium]
MIFEYNGNLNFNERVEKVTNEIITMYPNIEKSKAKMASIMEEPINKHLTYRNIYNRYYNIMLANINDFEFQKDVYFDMVEILGNTDDDVIKYKIKEFYNYFFNNGSFPEQ